MSEHKIVIEDGKVRFVYDDAVMDLLDEFDAPQVCRASHVEPHPSRPGWVADMRPSGGPILGAEGPMDAVAATCIRAEQTVADLEVALLDVAPFKSRAEALAAERAWLTANKGL